MDYVDANIVLYSLSDEGAKTEACRRLLESGKPLVTSSLTLDEVGYKVLKRTNPVDAAKCLRATLACPSITFVPFGRDLFEKFARLVEGGVYPRDAIHAVTAINSGCKVIYSEDPDFDKIPELKRKVPW